MNDFRARGLRLRFQPLALGLAADGQCIQMHQRADFFLDRRHATGFPEVDHVVL